MDVRRYAKKKIVEHEGLKAQYLAAANANAGAIEALQNLLAELDAEEAPVAPIEGVLSEGVTIPREGNDGSKS